METVKTGVFMFQFDNDEPQRIEDVFNHEPVTLQLSQTKPVIGKTITDVSAPAIVFKSKSGKEFKLFIKNCE